MILNEVGPVMKAMCLLGLNCGFGNSDIANLPKKAIDFDNGWGDFPREKTATPRRIPLWVETVDAIKGAIALRPSQRSRRMLAYAS